MTKRMVAGLGMAVAMLGLSACSPSDESLADKVKGATKLSDVFVNSCYKAGADPERIKHIATLAGWTSLGQLPDPPRGGKIIGAWTANVSGQRAILFAATGPDDRKGAKPGTSMRVCGMEYFGSLEPDFVSVASKQIDLKTVDPKGYAKPKPAGTVVLSESGNDDAGYQVILGRTDAGPLGGMTMAFAFKPIE